jgi:hypothetical protein
MTSLMENFSHDMNYQSDDIFSPLGVNLTDADLA